jgi:hypothetical protein
MMLTPRFFRLVPGVVAVFLGQKPREVFAQLECVERRRRRAPLGR